MTWPGDEIIAELEGKTEGGHSLAETNMRNAILQGKKFTLPTVRHYNTDTFLTLF